MDPEQIIEKINSAELKFSAARSGGPGGQNVNKVNTKIELRFNVPASVSFTDEEKELILTSLKNRINNAGDLLIISQSERSQLQNKKKAEELLYKLIAKALTAKPERKATGPTKASRLKRLDEKKKRGIIKSLRKIQEE